jgi:hypothetical protein
VNTSEQINEIAAALSKAQSKIVGAEKDGRNPHFNAKYSSLASVWEACRGPLTENNLSVTQGLSNDDNRIKCTTMLMHSSGQFIKSELSMTPQQGTPQAAGSCATYLRRYSLQAMVGVAPDDDDGSAASAPSPTIRAATSAPLPSSVVPGFDPTNKAHAEKLTAECMKRKIFGDNQKNLFAAMKGKSFSELEALIKATNPESVGE